MATLKEIRAQHPEYNDLSDQALADGVYKKFYSDMPRDQFDAKIGLGTRTAADLPTITPGGSDIGAVVGSRLAAGLIDIPGIPGDFVDLADTAGQLVGQGARRLLGMPAAPAAPTDAAPPSRPLSWLPRSQDVKDFVGFKPYEAQSAGGQTFDKYVGPAVEILPTLGGGIVKTALKTATEQGTKAAIKQGTGAVLKQAVAPAAASEVAGDLTKGTPYEVPARLVAAIVAGKGAGAQRGKVGPAPSVEQWRATGNQAFADMRAAGVGVKPSSFDRMVDAAEQALHTKDYRPALHGNVKVVLDEMKASKGVPQSFDELVQMHRLASRQMGNIDKDTARVAGLLADHIDDFMENLKPGDLMGGNPKAAFDAWKTGKDAWFKMRSGERIANIIEGSKDTTGANYTAAGQQTALRQAFKRFKWKGGVGKDYSREYKSLSPEGKRMVNTLIRGVSLNNAMRMIGKFNLKNPFVYALLGGLGVTMNPGALTLAGVATLGSGARALSARSTIRQATGLGDLVRGGQWTPGRFGRTPSPVIFGAAAQRETDRSK